MTNLKEKLFDLWWMLNSEADGYSCGQEISGFFNLKVHYHCTGACHSLSVKTGRVLAHVLYQMKSSYWIHTAVAPPGY